MAYILKNGESYIDKYGTSLPDAYAAIDDVIICKRKKTATIVLKLYTSAANTDKESVVTNQLICQNTTDEEGEAVNDFDTYFGVTVLNTSNAFAQAYAYWTYKEQSIGGDDFSSWESDE